MSTSRLDTRTSGKATAPADAHVLTPRTRLLAALALAAALAGCEHSDGFEHQGYVEGEFLYLAAPQAGYLQSLDAPRGGRVSPNQSVFVIAGDPDVEALAEAEARIGSARERVQNLKAPRRVPEIAALEANLRAAEAGQRLAATRLQQYETVFRKQLVSQAQVDDARAAHDQARAQVDSARQQLETYRATLGRQAEVRGAEADFEAAVAQAAQKRWVVERKTVTAPATGQITETYYRPGEWVPAGAPVASLLPDDRRRLRFFVPETVVGALRPGQPVEARCDGCPAPIRGVIDFIAPQAEYSPPVIYSRGVREKLVFRVEAAPVPNQAMELRPGLPLDVNINPK